jgi:hypothetical protein
MQILWFIPTGSHDGRYLGTDIGSRVATPDYLQQVAQAVDSLGYTGAQSPSAGVNHRERIAQLFIDNLKRYQTGQPLRNVVDKKAGY